ncbi:MAG: alpha-amylase family glycosyl hydrolase [Anaerolineae bacterium]
MHTQTATRRDVKIETPDWVKDAVFYQIFPDRFARSDKVLKPNNLQPWGAQPTVEGYQGGDLLGVVEHLDHLSDLGINAIYFTPIFQSASNHRYHTHDYEKVDPLLGGNTALRALVDEAHRRHIRVVLDGVFNHASRGFFPFNDILEHGPHSPWLDWFFIQGWPLAPYTGDRPANYVAWAGNRALPKLNTDNPQVREYIMGIAEFWLREFDIDGWRLDVPAEVKTPGFWEEFRRRVKAVNPDAYIVGEIWREAREWLQGDRFDAVMNYLFAASVIAFVAGKRVSPSLVKGRSYDPHPAIDAAQFGARIERLLNLYDWQVTQAQLNILDSHDTARLLSLARGDKASVRLATLFQMTYPGAPSVYYGDEIGLRGTLHYDKPHQDPDARWAFPWHDRGAWDTDLLAFFRAAIALRHSHRALRRGHFYQLYAEGDVYAFARRDDDETLVVALNVAEGAREVRLPLGAYFRDGVGFTPLLTAGGPSTTVKTGVVEDGQVRITLPARDGVVLGAA